ncbi:MAG: hypothetical protein P8J18_06795 [Halieaceae bacterium]|nr:hypothetical protein [Halieaceae bacterium]
MPNLTYPEAVSIYPFNDNEIDVIMHNAMECTLMWSTKDGWPVGVIHSFIWKDNKIWLTFVAHRHRAAAIRRDNRVSVTNSSRAYEPDAQNLPVGGITFKGKGVFFDDDDTKRWFYKALSEKNSPDNPESMSEILNSPTRLILCVTPTKKIMYNKLLAEAHARGVASEEMLGKPLESDAIRMNKPR